MSVTFYVEDWHKQESFIVKKYCSETYDLPEECFIDDPFLKKDDDGRHYEEEIVYKDPFPSLYCTSIMFSQFFDLLGDKYSSQGEISLSELPEFSRKIIFLINSNKKNKYTLDSYQENNFFQSGISEEQFLSKLHSLLEIVKFSQNHKKSIYWG